MLERGELLGEVAAHHRRERLVALADPALDRLPHLRRLEAPGPQIEQCVCRESARALSVALVPTVDQHLPQRGFVEDSVVARRSFRKLAFEKAGGVSSNPLRVLRGSCESGSVTRSDVACRVKPDEEEAMHAFLTVRKLKSGSYDDWRRAWEPDEWPQGSKKAYILRNVDDSDEIIAFGFFDTALETLRDDPDLRASQRARFERMAPHVESTGTDGIYEVIDEVTP